MTLIIVLNALLSLGVVVMAATPLVWAIFTQHRDHAVIERVQRRAGRVPHAAPRSARAQVRPRPAESAA